MMYRYSALEKLLDDETFSQTGQGGFAAKEMVAMKDAYICKFDHKTFTEN